MVQPKMPGQVSITPVGAELALNHTTKLVFQFGHVVFEQMLLEIASTLDKLITDSTCDTFIEASSPIMLHHAGVNLHTSDYLVHLWDGISLFKSCPSSWVG